MIIMYDYERKEHPILKIIETRPGFLQGSEDMLLRGASTAVCPAKDFEGCGDTLMIVDALDSRGQNLTTTLLRSKDGGKTYTPQTVFEQRFVYAFDGSSRRDGYGSLYSDTLRGVMLYFGTELYFEKNDPKSDKKKRKIYYKISFDNGYTWSDKRQIIQFGISTSGRGYDKTHFMHGVKYGHNMATLSVPNVVRTRDNLLAFGVAAQQVNSQFEPVDYIGESFFQSGVLKAKWNNASTGYDFYFGDWARVDVDESTKGIYEPVLAPVNGERLLMLCRGTNISRPSLMGCRFMSLSVDDGLSWSKPEKLLYDDGEPVFSASSGARLVSHSNEKLYYIGVINGQNPHGSYPRYPLCIAEIDKYSCRLKRKSVFPVITKPDGEEDANAPYPVDFTGHWCYEAPDGNLVLLVPNRTDLTKFGSRIDQYIIAV